MSETESDNTLEQPAPAPAPARRRRGGGLTLLLMLVLLAGAAGGGWYGWQFYQHQQAQTASNEQQLKDMRAELTALRSDNEERLDELGEELDETRGELAARRQAMQEMRSGGQTTWLLNEAEALASLAQQRLLLSADLAAAERLLKAADQVLARVEDAQVVSAREALATDLEKLRGAQRVDITGLILRLGALRPLVADLAVPAARRSEDAPAPEQQDAGWWTRLVEQLPVTVQRHDDAVPLPLDQEQASLVRLHLLNDLQKAQLALMQSRPEVYRQALEGASDTLNTWFAPQAPRTAQLLSAIDELREAPVDQALPEIGNGLDAIRGLIGDREARP